MVEKVKKFFRRSPKDIAIALAPPVGIFLLVAFIGYQFVEPPVAMHIKIAASTGEGDYTTYANRYKEILKADGIDLEIEPSKGAVDNLLKMEDSDSDVDVAFIQDGMGEPDKFPGLISLGSLYYEPVWVFYNGKETTKISGFKGKR